MHVRTFRPGNGCPGDNEIRVLTSKETLGSGGTVVNGPCSQLIYSDIEDIVAQDLTDMAPSVRKYCSKTCIL